MTSAVLGTSGALLQPHPSAAISAQRRSCAFLLLEASGGGGGGGEWGGGVEFRQKDPTGRQRAEGLFFLFLRG